MRQTDHPILASRSDLVLINKKKRAFYFVDFSVPAGHRVIIKESRNINKYLERTKIPVKHESDGDSSCSCCTWNGF